MKKLHVNYYALFLLLLSYVLAPTHQAFAQRKGPVLFLTENTKDFGVVKQGQKVEHKFVFVNKGDAPLIINDLRFTCGCTSPSWTKTPVMPGEKGEILIVFDTKDKEGVQNKVITVYSNAENAQERINLRISIIPN